MTIRSHTTQRGSAHRGFTVVEILIVVAIILLLMSLLIVAVSQASKRARGANTQFLMTSMSQAMIRFREDIGYLPPILGDPSPSAADDLRALWSPASPDTPPDQAWFSITSPADYLLGYGNEQQDGHGGDPDPTQPALGIRSPGPDGAWSASINGTGALSDRNTGAGVGGRGKVYGPYLELDGEQFLAAADATGRILFPGEPGYTDDLPKVIVDTWGNPIRYYRRLYPPGALNQSYRAVDRDGDGVIDPAPTLSDFFVLRPFEFPSELAAEGPPDALGDTSTSIELEGSEFAFFSAGADNAVTADIRYDDPDFFNADNLTEVGK